MGSAYEQLCRLRDRSNRYLLMCCYRCGEVLDTQHEKRTGNSCVHIDQQRVATATQLQCHEYVTVTVLSVPVERSDARCKHGDGADAGDRVAARLPAKNLQLEGFDRLNASGAG